MSIDKEIEAANDQLTKLVESLNTMIAELPDNPRIHRLNDKCFVMKHSDLGNNWSVEHHDFKWQYRAIVDSLKSASDSGALDRLRKIIADGKILIPHSERQYVALHPDVIVNLKTLLT